MRPYNEYRQFTPNPEGGGGAPAAMQRCLITASRRTANAMSCHLKAKPPDSEHVLILNASLTDKGVYFKGLRAQLFAKWSFVIVYPTSLIRHKSKYSVSETIIYYVNYRLCTSVAFQRWHRGGHADVWYTVFFIIFIIIIPLFNQGGHISNAGTDVCVCALRRDHFNCFLIPAESTLNTYCLINNASLYKGLLLFVYTHNENKKRKQIGSPSAIWVSFLWTN